MPGTLYLLPVQLGDTPWQVVMPSATRDIACRLNYFIVENAKTARASLKWLEHPTPLRDIAISPLPERPTADDLDRLIAPLETGVDVGMMSEAGCPAVADPGALVVRRAHERSIQVKPLVGPSSLLLALMASGLDGQQFSFHGYLPAREPDRSQRIVQLERESHSHRQTQLFIETPYRNQQLFEALRNTCRPKTRLCVASDMTTALETVLTRTIDQWKKAPPPALDRRPTVFLLLA